jgi:tetratricopeptide (TPR) repeat protein
MNHDGFLNTPSSRRSPDEAYDLSIDETEKRLLQELESTPDKKIQLMWTLAQFYKNAGMAEMAEPRFRQLLDTVTELEAKAQIVLALGQMAEQADDFCLAVSFYRQALSMEPADSWTWYFINNNLGYSYNQLKRYEEGETCCRRAIATDPKFPNAHKNLGLALLGQHRLREAAACFVDATRADARDPRATDHLTELLVRSPELSEEFGPQLESCNIAVKEATINYLRAMHAEMRKLKPKGDQ